MWAEFRTLIRKGRNKRNYCGIHGGVPHTWDESDFSSPHPVKNVLHENFLSSEWEKNINIKPDRSSRLRWTQKPEVSVTFIWRGCLFFLLLRNDSFLYGHKCLTHRGHMHFLHHLLFLILNYSFPLPTVPSFFFSSFSIEYTCIRHLPGILELSVDCNFLCVHHTLLKFLCFI